MGGEWKFFWCAGIGTAPMWGLLFFLKKKRIKRKQRGRELALGARCGAVDFRSFLFRQKGTEKPERHARSGKSRESPHFRSGRARSRDVGCYWNWPRPACASPPRKRASGFACTPLRRRSALAGAWLRGRVKPSLGLGKGVSRKREEPSRLQPTTSLGDGGREPQAPDGHRREAGAQWAQRRRR